MWYGRRSKVGEGSPDQWRASSDPVQISCTLPLLLHTRAHTDPTVDGPRRAKWHVLRDPEVRTDEVSSEGVRH